MIALKNDRPELARHMIDAGTDVNLAALNGVTPLMAAAHAGYAEIVRSLISKGANLAAVDQLKKNAMTYAAGQGRTEIVLLCVPGGHPNAATTIRYRLWVRGYASDTLRSLLRARRGPSDYPGQPRSTRA